MAAKLEQPMTPSISRMIKLLSDQERENVTKERVIRCESEILNAFDFDFNFVNSMPVLERFIRLTDQHNNFSIDLVALEILKVAAAQSKFLCFRPSQLAASALVIAKDLEGAKVSKNNNSKVS